MLRTRPTILLTTTLLLLLAACGREPDTTGLLEVHKFVSITETDAISLPGQVVPASTDTATLWLGPGLARRDVKGGSLLVHAAQDRVTWLDHQARTWTSQTASELQRQLADLATDTLDRRRQDPRLARLRTMLKVSVAVTDTGDRSEIDGYHCRRWIVEQRQGDQTTTTELWLTNDIVVDWNLLHRITRPTLAALVGGRQAVAELSRLEGFPVRAASVMDVMSRRGRATTRLVAVETEMVPAEHFTPPADYRSSGPTAPASGHSE